MPLILDLRAYLFRLFTSLKTFLKPATPLPAPTDEPHLCRFRLDDDSSDTLTLPDGRKLGYAQYGSLTGRPIFYLHGLPGSRIEGALFHDLGLELGARIIGIDRPGMGWSSYHPGRTLLDHPKDVEQLAQHLGLDKYSVLGISGGGPYALACARVLPRDKLRCVSIVVGIGPPDIGMRGASLVSWVGFTFGWRYGPHFVNRWWWQRQPAARLDLSDEERFALLMRDLSKSMKSAHKKDVEAMRDEDFFQLSLRSAREVYAQGFDGMLLDGELISSPFGFMIEDIRPDLPVQLWYGKFDTTVPLNHGVQIAARLGGRAHFRVEDETHLSMSVNRRKEILENLVHGT